MCYLFFVRSIDYIESIGSTNYSDFVVQNNVQEDGKDFD